MLTTVHVSNTADDDKYGNSRGNFPAKNGNRENGRENTPTVSVPVPARFPVLFAIFLFFPRKRFTVGLNGKRSRSGRDFPVPFSTLAVCGVGVAFLLWAQMGAGIFSLCN